MTVLELERQTTKPRTPKLRHILPFPSATRFLCGKTRNPGSPVYPTLPKGHVACAECRSQCVRIYGELPA